MLKSFMAGKGIFIAGIFSIHPFHWLVLQKVCKVQLTLPLHLFLSMIFSANSFPVDLWKEPEQ